MSAPPTTEDHIAEHIPWDQLTISPPPDRRRLWYAIAGALFIVAIVSVLARSWSPTASEFTPVVPVVTTPPSTVAAALAAPVAADLLSEADLRAVDPLETRQAVVARAEWFVLEYFSLDPGDDWAERVGLAGGLLIDGQPETDAAAVSYVEWVRVDSVTSTEAGQFDVTVLVRRLVALDGSSYQRLPVERVRLALAVDDEAIRVIELPTVDELDRLDPDEIEVGEPREGSGGIGWPTGR